MTHEMRLNAIPFNAIRSGKQQIETRLYDEKRQAIKVGDTITFYLRPEEVESFTAEVIGLSIFKSFKDLFQAIEKIKFGYEENDTLDYQINCMLKYYSEEDQVKDGVVGIHLGNIQI